MNFYIADNHFGHRDMIFYDGRPFTDTTVMNEVLVRNWNEKVNENDTIYMLGDCFWMNEENSVRLMQRLNGHKHLIRGNHDRVHGRFRFQYESIRHYAEIEDNGRKVILSHYPMPFYNEQYNGAVMLYGHVHNTIEWEFLEKWKRELWEKNVMCNMINVGCMMEYMQYTPKTLDEILEANLIPGFQ